MPGTTDERPFNPLRAGPIGGRSDKPVVIGFADEEEIARASRAMSPVSAAAWRPAARSAATTT